MDYFWIILIIVVASLVKGITGFGFAMVSLPLLLFWYSPKVVIPVLILCNFFASLMIVLQKKEYKLINRHFKSLIIYGGCTTILGVLTLRFMSSNILILSISIFFIIVSILYLFNIKYSRRVRKYTYKIAGAVCGFLTGSISVGGPPLALFLNLRQANNRQFREIFAWFNIITAAIAIFGYALLGLLTMETIKLSLLFIPILLLGTFFGKKINTIIPAKRFRRITVIMSLISSILLLINCRS